MLPPPTFRLVWGSSSRLLRSLEMIPYSASITLYPIWLFSHPSPPLDSGTLSRKCILLGSASSALGTEPAMGLGAQYIIYSMTPKRHTGKSLFWFTSQCSRGEVAARLVQPGADQQCIYCSPGKLPPSPNSDVLSLSLHWPSLCSENLAMTRALPLSTDPTPGLPFS